MCSRDRFRALRFPAKIIVAESDNNSIRNILISLLGSNNRKEKAKNDNINPCEVCRPLFFLRQLFFPENNNMFIELWTSLFRARISGEKYIVYRSNSWKNSHSFWDVVNLCWLLLLKIWFYSFPVVLIFSWLNVVTHFTDYWSIWIGNRVIFFVPHWKRTVIGFVWSVVRV